jgi:hypothetical protein
VRTILRSRSWLAAQNGGRLQAGEQLQLVRIQGLQSYLQSSDGKQSNGREGEKDHKIFWMAKTEALISAVESRCIRAIERARGGAGRFGFQ